MKNPKFLGFVLIVLFLAGCNENNQVSTDKISSTASSYLNITTSVANDSVLSGTYISSQEDLSTPTSEQELIPQLSIEDVKETYNCFGNVSKVNTGHLIVSQILVEGTQSDDFAIGTTVPGTEIVVNFSQNTVVEKGVYNTSTNSFETSALPINDIVVGNQIYIWGSETASGFSATRLMVFITQ